MTSKVQQGLNLGLSLTSPTHNPYFNLTFGSLTLCQVLSGGRQKQLIYPLLIYSLSLSIIWCKALCIIIVLSLFLDQISEWSEEFITRETTNILTSLISLQLQYLVSSCFLVIQRYSLLIFSFISAWLCLFLRYTVAFFSTKWSALSWFSQIIRIIRIYKVCITLCYYFYLMQMFCANLYGFKYLQCQYSKSQCNYAVKFFWFWLFTLFVHLFLLA